MKRMPAIMPLLLLVVLGGSALILHGRAVASAVLSNAGWVMLNDRLTRPQIGITEIGGQQSMFARASALNGGNQSAAFGRGLTYALAGQSEEAIVAWTTAAGSDGATLGDYALTARDSGNLDVALTQFRAAAVAEPASHTTQMQWAGTACQLSFASPNDLSPPNQQFCAEYWPANDNNLFVNATFEEGLATAWRGQHHFLGRAGARLAIEQSPVGVGYSARLEGLDERNHFGLFQRITLSAGDRVRFSGRFKMAGDEQLKARLLYVGWQDSEGAAQGNQAALVEGQSEWQYYEREFEVPDNSLGSFDFYPALFSGVGNVWFDDIQLQIIRD